MQGAMTALITPFKNGKVDEETYARLIQRQIDNSIDFGYIFKHRSWI